MPAISGSPGKSPNPYCPTLIRVVLSSLGMRLQFTEMENCWLQTDDENINRLDIMARCCGGNPMAVKLKPSEGDMLVSGRWTLRRT